MRNKSSKLARLEKNRFSIITDDLEHCIICRATKDDLHEIFGGCRRKVSMQFGLVLPVCRRCHSYIERNEDVKLKWKKIGEELWLVTYKPFDVEKFIEIFGKNYL